MGYFPEDMPIHASDFFKAKTLSNAYSARQRARRENCVDDSSSLEDRIIAAIESDLCDRKGLKWEWNSIRGDIRDEIRATWREIIRQEIALSPNNDGQRQQAINSIRDVVKMSGEVSASVNRFLNTLQPAVIGQIFNVDFEDKIEPTELW